MTGLPNRMAFSDLLLLYQDHHLFLLKYSIQDASNRPFHHHAKKQIHRPHYNIDRLRIPNRQDIAAIIQVVMSYPLSNRTSLFSLISEFTTISSMRIICLISADSHIHFMSYFRNLKGQTRHTRLICTLLTGLSSKEDTYQIVTDESDLL